MTWALVALFAMLVIGFVWLALREHDVHELAVSMNEQVGSLNRHAKAINKLAGRVAQLENGQGEPVDDAPSGRHSARVPS